MNRAERRRQQRKTPVLVAGDGVVAAALGHKYEARPSRQLAPKVAGKHRWIASGAWVLSDTAVQAAHDPDTMKFLDNENLMYLGIGCWDCEKALGEVQPGSYCPAPGDD